MLTGDWNYPTQIRFGAGRIAELGDVLIQINSQNPLLVTDKGLAKSLIIDNIMRLLKQSQFSVQIFSEVKSNPTGSNITAGVNAYRQGNHDAVIAVGGGSALDAGKAIALMVGQNRDLFDFEDVGDHWTRIKTDNMAPVIAVPTTSGTGSEVGRAAVIVNEQWQQKCIIFHPNMLPEYVIADAELSIGLPAHLTAATGIDALVHSLEAYCSLGYHPMADGIALQAIHLIKSWLLIAFENGQNIEARSHMLAAATMGATAFQKGLGAVHALAHPLGAVYDKHHGLLNAILLPYVLDKNRFVIQQKICFLNRYLDLDNGFNKDAEIKNSRPKDSVDTFISWILQLRNQLDIPHTLNDIGIDTSDCKKIAGMALKDAAAAGNPQSLTEDEYSEIFCNAVSGQLTVRYNS